MNNPDTIESLRAERNQYKTALERIVLLSHNPNEDRSLRMIEMRKTAQNALSRTSEEGKMSFIQRWRAWREKRRLIRNCPGHVMQPWYHSWSCKHCPYEECD